MTLLGDSEWGNIPTNKLPAAEAEIQDFKAAVVGTDLVFTISRGKSLPDIIASVSVLEMAAILGDATERA